MDEYTPIHTEVWRKLDEQAKQIHDLERHNKGLKKRVRTLRWELKRERQRNEELRGEKKSKQRYRNKQKHGNSRNG